LEESILDKNNKLFLTVKKSFPSRDGVDKIKRFGFRILTYKDLKEITRVGITTELKKANT